MNTEIRLKYRLLSKKQISILQWWEFIEGCKKEEVNEVVTWFMEVERRLYDYKNSPLYLNKIRKYCNYFGYSDVYPYEVVKIISAKTVEIRAMNAIEIKHPTEFYPGGFSGHYADNHSQEWLCTVNTNNPVQRIHLGKKGWGNGKFRMMDKPHKFYDYNF